MSEVARVESVNLGGVEIGTGHGGSETYLVPKGAIFGLMEAWRTDVARETSSASRSSPR